MNQRSVKRAAICLFSSILLVMGTSSLTGCRGSKADVPDDAASETSSDASESQPAEPTEMTPAETTPPPEETTPPEPVEPEPVVFDHSAYDALLAAHVDQDAGRVDYDGLKAKEGELDAYLATIASADLGVYDDQEVFALLINAYNAYTLKLILERYPKIKSINDYKEPWKQERWEVGGETLSLDAIEHERLRPVYKDPRIHFAVNCASIGCPPLRAEAYTGEQLEEQLEAATRETLSNERYVKVKSGSLRVSKIMDWYGDDFVNPEWKGTGKHLADFIKPYASEEVAAFIEEKGGKPKVRFLDYNWNLNKK